MAGEIMIATTCATCAKVFEIPDSYARRGRGRFCSRLCFHQSRRGGRALPRTPAEKLALKRAYRATHQDDIQRYNATRYDTERTLRYRAPLRRVDLVCQRCGSIFHAFPFEASSGRRKYCSKACMYACTKVTATCTSCGSERQVSHSRRETPARFFCSLRCAGEWLSTHQRGAAHPMWKGGISPFTYAREFHQKRPRILARDNYRCQVCGQHRSRMTVHHIDENPENHDDNNLVTVCPHCHRGVIHGTNEVTFDSERRAIWKADGTFCKEKSPKK